jgi:putative phosphoesterase
MKELYGMKLAFISDIHGNSEALKAVLKDIEKRQVDKIVVLGDLCFRGLNSKESLELVRQLNTDVIRGNADEWVVRGVKKGEVNDTVLDIMNAERDWTVSQLDSMDLDYLASLPLDYTLEEEGVRLHAFHATPHDLFEVVQPEQTDTIKEKLFTTDADLFIYAHIHKAFIRTLDGKMVMNLGSVGMPFDGVRKASYAIVEIQDGSFSASLIKVNYDIEKVIQQLNNSDYPNKAFLIKVLSEASV